MTLIGKAIHHNKATQRFINLTLTLSLTCFSSGMLSAAETPDPFYVIEGNPSGQWASGQEVLPPLKPLTSTPKDISNSSSSTQQASPTKPQPFPMPSAALPNDPPPVEKKPWWKKNPLKKPAPPPPEEVITQVGGRTYQPVKEPLLRLNNTVKIPMSERSDLLLPPGFYLAQLSEDTTRIWIGQRQQRLGSITVASIEAKPQEPVEPLKPNSNPTEQLSIELSPNEPQLRLRLTQGNKVYLSDWLEIVQDQRPVLYP